MKKWKVRRVDSRNIYIDPVAKLRGRSPDLEDAYLLAAAPLLLETLLKTFFDIGRAGANHDTKHPLRKTWLELRKVLNEANPLIFLE